MSDTAESAQADVIAHATPAATVVVVRDRSNGLEVLMLRRNAALAFAAGAWVFPGGRVDPSDVEGAHPGDELRAARNCASREAEEEAGLRLVADQLVVLSRWSPPPQAPRWFNTWFFLAAAGAEEVVIDGGEIHDHVWISPTEAMARQAAGDIELFPPTWVTLWGLAAHRDVASALAAANARPLDEFVTRLVDPGDGRRALLWAGDAGYRLGELDLTGGRHRLWLHETPWRYERAATAP